ncbi:hypothetical protein [Flavimarina sp. Hel_I_48]|uniref:hypothetical protein n=1 Tax=Flavimarina sp. Hel_I_48 TaxID=1392488 RepID=UPI0004DED8A7|nr:hypothetical protein [Flavimarina sp. Hel_I_48]
MGDENLKSKSVQELKSELKTTQVITTALISVISLLVAVTMYGLIYLENKAVFIALITVAISCGAIIPIQLVSIKKIKTEIKSR